MMALNRKVRAIVRREYLQRVRTRSFLISTLLVPVLIVGISILPPLLAHKNSEARTLRIAVIDESSDNLDVHGGDALADRLVARLREAKVEVSKAPELTKLSALELENSAAKDSAVAYVILSPRVVASGSTQVLTTGRIHDSDRRILETAFRQALLSERLSRQSVGEVDAEWLARAPQLDYRRATETTGASELTQGVGFAFAFAVYMMLMVYGGMIARGVQEEKSSDVVEVMVSSVRPWEMMLGKILGVSAVGLTQVAIWVVVGAGALLWGMAGIVAAFPEVATAFANFHLPIGLVVAAALYFLFGYFLYAGLFAAAGAMMSREGDAQQVLMPLMLLLIVPFMFLSEVADAPNLPWVVAASLFPLFSPILMIPRMTATAVPAWQSLTSLGLLGGSIFLTAWLAGRIYRVGILMKGKRPNLPELVRWIRHG